MTPETQRAVERVAELFDAAPWLESDETGIPGALHVTYADLSRMVTALSEASAREGVLRGALKAFIDWGQQQCPCRDETPDPCPLCGATVAAGRCRAVEAKFPPRILADARTALSRTTPIEEA